MATGSLKTTVLPEELNSIALRLARVDECIFQVIELSAQWSFDAPVRLEQHERGGRYETVVANVRPLPPRLWLLFSEGIHHLRSSLDNAVWYLAQGEGGVTDANSWLVDMPIASSAEQFVRWAKKRSQRGLKFADPLNPVGQRIVSLQPYSDADAVIPSRLPALAFCGVESEMAHALTLLKDYSNADKHRRILVAEGGSVITSADEALLSQNLQFQRLSPGKVVGSGTLGEFRFVEMQSAALVARTGSYSALVSPGTELSLLRDYVRDTALPILLRGLYMPSAIPSQIELGDNGQDYAARIAAGSDVDAKQRFVPRQQEMFAAAEARDPELPIFVRHDPSELCELCFQPSSPVHAAS